jgi:phosphoribosylformimino-5-aminoimidazole carboxamide ribotide isomerase
MIIPTMRIVPVLDLMGGVVVHAQRGDRAGYAPLRSPLVDGSEPVAVATALCARAGSERLYVADLDAIAGAPADVATLRRLAAVAELWVDAGATTAARAEALHKAGAARNVVGTESLTDAGYRGSDGAAYRAGGGAAYRAGDGPAPVLSVDLRDGLLISPRPQLAGRGPEAAVALARELAVNELLVIDLARVGSRAGPPLEAVATLAAALPGVHVYAGGGVRDDRDLDALARAGAAGALVATALHDGAVNP